MRTVYLIRHAHPDYPLGQRTCLGRTDTPLGPLGRMQAVLLGEELKSAGIESVFSSPLTRCLETAAALGRPIDAVPELAEQDMGLWDGLSFDEIKEHWPELCERREHDSLLVPLGAETLQQVRERVLPAFVACLWRSKGTTAVVAHASVIQTILAELLETPLAESRSLRPPCSAYAVLEQGKSLRCIEMARMPRAAMDRRLAAKLLEASGVPEPVQRHARAVAAEAQRVAALLPLPIDRETLVCAALLHDVARTEPEHARLGERWLRALGFEKEAALVGQHHDLRSEDLDEAAILYLADKCVQGEKRVTLEERFAASESRCRGPEARQAHEKRRLQAEALRRRVNEVCGRTVVV